MIEQLLPYYEKQLQEFGQQSREFAQKYPKIAQRLSLNQEQIDDPHIERLIQAFSLIAARIDKKLEDSYDVFTHSLFEVMFPQYLRHFPACTVVSFEDINKLKQLTAAHVIPQKTALKSRSFKGVQCEFNTTNEVRLLPISLTQLEFQTSPSIHMHLNQNATLSLKFEIFNEAQKWILDEKLPIYLDAISNFPLQVLDSIFRKDTGFALRVGPRVVEISNPFEVMGFTEQESLLPIDQHTHHAYRLLMEYFCFPEKFNYLNLDLSRLKGLLGQQNQFEILIHLKLNLNDQAVVRNYSELNVANFKLFTTPAINLFEKQAEPQKISHTQLQYPLITDAHHPELYQVYSVIEMNMVREKTNQEQTHLPVLPFFAMSHYHNDKVQFFYSLNYVPAQNKTTQMGYSIVSKHLKPYEIKSDFISTRLLCSNGDLPHEALSQSNNILNLNDSSLARRALILKRPTSPFYFDKNKNEQWRIISHLSLNTLALMKGDALSHVKELLALYNLPHSKENILLIDALKQLSFSTTNKLVNSKPFPMFIRGVKAELAVNKSVFRGHSLYIFSQLLSHVFNLKVQINSFVDVVVKDSLNQQEIYQCVQNVGGKTLL
ncbi:type VI secretion system baseplate subunit TssF [Acinetobacter courvalinii]|uniref:Type VI secretion system baseplate subunit TssF n=1 Tax=Acinetobacter courvalinii TaxID=280147 RepID=A0AA42I7Q7_9GAMM|nr:MULTISPECIES: type VI secretion system baseplate subunit TssF [Acinetobacter]WPE82424.1 type VI secretion system baseplate subunit TssF [Acinetobacter baumannii]ENX07495.1 type VI secretion protein [Acinetobacter courvalinii]MBJ9956986.1 type VI secretion system baseplate subunit TssF [Acinetobacter courvalinii]MCU4391790.1 type VI secretion system baseplate subunit TssF [Acinetobacter courvalinii]MCU4639569.1 type VI secretion system baseplate subunit TssF [Acinetobacter courvalinii]